MPSETTTLYFKDGSSDKVYQASIDPSGTGFVVNFAYGRRGSTLTAGCKTPGPVDFAAAKKVYDKLINEKKAKGYQAGANGATVAPAATTTTTAQQPATGMPQLLNAIDDDELERLMNDDSFWMQQKFDGKRIMIKKTNYSVIASNRKGLSCGFSAKIEKDIKDITVYRNVENFVLDGEMIGDEYFVFDILQLGGKDLRDLPYHERHAKLLGLIPIIHPYAVKLVFIAYGEGDKRRLFERIKREKLEGVVFKKKDSLYRAGRPASGGNQLKYKFVETCSCVVMNKPTGKAQSVWLQMLNDKGQWEAVGKCTIPANFKVPVPGKIVEIRYLYAYKGGSLYQPVYLGERDDILESACIRKQLKYKPEDSDDDA